MYYNELPVESTYNLYGVVWNFNLMLYCHCHPVVEWWQRNRLYVTNLDKHRYRSVWANELHIWPQKSKLGLGFWWDMLTSRPHTVMVALSTFLLPYIRHVHQSEAPCRVQACVFGAEVAQLLMWSVWRPIQYMIRLFEAKLQPSLVKTCHSDMIIQTMRNSTLVTALLVCSVSKY